MQWKLWYITTGIVVACMLSLLSCRKEQSAGHLPESKMYMDAISEESENIDSGSLPVVDEDADRILGFVLDVDSGRANLVESRKLTASETSILSRKLSEADQTLVKGTKEDLATRFEIRLGGESFESANGYVLIQRLGESSRIFRLGGNRRFVQWNDDRSSFLVVED